LICPQGVEKSLENIRIMVISLSVEFYLRLSSIIYAVQRRVYGLGKSIE